MGDVVDTREHRSNRGAVIIAGSILVAGIAIGAGIYLSRAERPPPGAQGERRGRDELTLTGTVVMDGTTNGCGGENILVEVRESSGNVVSESVPSDFVGLDCAFPFALEVPRLDCYEVVISQTVVGDYPREALELGSKPGVLDIGYIDSTSVFGQPGAFEVDGPRDWPYGCGQGG